MESTSLKKQQTGTRGLGKRIIAVLCAIQILVSFVMPTLAVNDVSSSLELTKIQLFVKRENADGAFLYATYTHNEDGTYTEKLEHLYDVKINVGDSVQFKVNWNVENAKELLDDSIASIEIRGAGFTFEDDLSPRPLLDAAGAHGDDNSSIATAQIGE